jgi:hypothetical protein
MYARFIRCVICFSRRDNRRHSHSFNGSMGAEKFKIRENYIVPFLQWCTEFYGDLYEFKFRYVRKDFENLNLHKFSDIQVILDYRSLHNSLIDSYRWIGKIENEKSDVSLCLTRLQETVDKFWHRLENDYPNILPSVGDVKEFNAHIKATLSGIDQKRSTEIATIANKIRTHLLEKQREGEEYAADDFKKILDYLKSKIP